MRHAFQERRQLPVRPSAMSARALLQTVQPAGSDPALYLDIAGQGAAITSHAELWRWLQGDVQQFLAHDILLIGWGDFRSGDLQFDVVSSLPGVRSQNDAGGVAKPLLAYLRDCWAGALHLPCQVDLASWRGMHDGDTQAAPFSRSIAAMRSAVVHGMGDRSQGGERVFAALSSRGGAATGAPASLKLLMPFIDTALRQIAPLPLPQTAAQRLDAARLALRQDALTDREREIMVWVAMGKTNPEIGCILHISEFTVKNHMKSIFSKLDVTNRAQAVSKLSLVPTHA